MWIEYNIDPEDYKDTHINGAGCNPDVFIYNKLIRIYGNKGNINEMEKTLKELKSKFTPNIQTYSSLLFGYSKLGMINKAIGIIKQMKNQNIKPNKYMYKYY